MPNTLTSPKVATLLDRLYADAAQNDPKVMARMEAALGVMNRNETYDKREPFLDQAYIPVAPEVGRLFYLLTRTRRPKLVVEFGTSFGISAIHYASALRDNGMGRLVTTEKAQNKADRARENIEASGLSDLIDLRVGDAFETLKTIDENIDLLFLDGWKDMYLPLLKFLEPRLAPGALIVADDVSRFAERMAGFLDYIRNPANNYLSVEVPVDDGVELSIRN